MYVDSTGLQPGHVCDSISKRVGSSRETTSLKDSPPGNLCFGKRAHISVECNGQGSQCWSNPPWKVQREVPGILRRKFSPTCSGKDLC